MTDLEKIQLSLLRLADESSGPASYWLRRLAEQIAKDEAKRTEDKQG